MNILDINALPVLELKITGREGVATSVTIINQESKDVTYSNTFAYIKDDTLTVSIVDDAFIDKLEVNSTLSVIVYGGDVPLYRDIVRFRGELNTAIEFTQYDTGDDYFVYESPQFSEDDIQVDYGGSDVSGSTDTGENTTPIDAGGGDNGDTTTTPEFDTGDLVVSDYSVTYDVNNDGRGEMIYDTSVDGKMVQHDRQNLGDFKVRSEEYGTFNETPSSLEAVTVYSYYFNENTGNLYGYDVDVNDESINPDLTNTLEVDWGSIAGGTVYIGPRKYFSFSEGRDEPFSEALKKLQLREENSLSNADFETTIYKEDSITDWTVGMSIYSDAIGTSVTDSYVDEFDEPSYPEAVVTSSVDRYHFISKNSAGNWVLVRCTDGIVTHVEEAESEAYLKLIQMYNVWVSNIPFEIPPKGRLATIKAWILDKLADENKVFSDTGYVSFTSSLFYINPSKSLRFDAQGQDYTQVVELSGNVIAPTGTQVYSHKYPWSSTKVMHENLKLESAIPEAAEYSDEDRYDWVLLAPKYDPVTESEFYEQPWLLLEIDKSTATISDREWITP